MPFALKDITEVIFPKFSNGKLFLRVYVALIAIASPTFIDLTSSKYLLSLPCSQKPSAINFSEKSSLLINAPTNQNGLLSESRHFL